MSELQAVQPRPAGASASSTTDRQIVALVRAALAEKLLLWTALGATIALWAWACYEPLPLRLAGAAGFTGMAYLPLLFRRG